MVVIIIEAKDEDFKELIDMRDLYRDAAIPVNSFATKVFNFLDGVRSVVEKPVVPPLPVEAPDIEP